LFRTKHYQLLPSTSLLCRLGVLPHTKNNNIEIQTDDLHIFDTLDKCVKKVEAAMKLFMKWGKQRAAQEILEDDG
jgi:hypothetical protein